MLFEIKPFVFRLRFPREPASARPEKTRLNPVCLAMVPMDLWPRFRIYGLFSKTDTAARQKMENAPLKPTLLSRLPWGEKTNKQVFFDAGFCPPLGHTYRFPSYRRIVLLARTLSVILLVPRRIGNINILDQRRPNREQVPNYSTTGPGRIDDGDGFRPSNARPLLHGNENVYAPIILCVFLIIGFGTEIPLPYPFFGKS